MMELKFLTISTITPTNTLSFPHHRRFCINNRHFNNNFINFKRRRFDSYSVKCTATTNPKPLISDDRMLVFVPPHPLIKHWVSVLRNEETPCPVFKNAMGELGRLLMYEASRDWLPTIQGDIQTPMAVAKVEFIDPREPVMYPSLDAMFDAIFIFGSFRNSLSEFTPGDFDLARRNFLPLDFPPIQLAYQIMGIGSPFPVKFLDPQWVIPILRAGLALAEHAASILPATKTYHLGLSRDEETLQPTVYLNKLPDKFPEGARILVVDPMLATGGTVIKAIDLIKERGVGNKQIKVISAVAAPPALQKLSEKCPGLHVYTGTIDEIVNDKGFIIPGLGDAGDRSYGT